MEIPLLAKFTSLLEANSLYFATGDTFADPWEGALGKAKVLRRPELYDRETLTGLRDTSRASTDLYISCWHAQEAESAAMWSLYAGWDATRHEGVAIRSTFRRLVESISYEGPFFAGTVKYLDYDHEFVPEDNLFEKWMRKRLSVAHEREIRVIVPKPPTTKGAPNGLLLGCDLTRMVSEVRVAPSSPVWFTAAVRAVVRRFGRTFVFNQSAMDAAPLL